MTSYKFSLFGVLIVFCVGCIQTMHGYLSTPINIESTIDSLAFSYNPNFPSPTVGGATLNSSLDQGPYDQGPLVESRFDLVTFETSALAQDLKIKGKIGVNFFISSDKKDTDVAIRITDVYPGGRSMLLLDGK